MNRLSPRPAALFASLWPSDWTRSAPALALSAGMVAMSALAGAGLSALTPSPAHAATSVAPRAPAGKPIGIAPKGAFTSEAPASAPLDEASDELFRERAEAKVLRKVGPLAKRDGLRLMLATTRGRPALLDSTRPEPYDGGTTPYVDYRLDGLTKDEAFYIVRATLAFGEEVLWVSREDGQRYEMHGNVHPSPDGRHLVVTHASDGVEFNGIKVWSRDGSRLAEQFKLQPNPEQPVSFRFMRWKDAHTVELEQFARVPEDRLSDCPSGTMESLAVLDHKNGQWILRSASRPRCQR